MADNGHIRTMQYVQEEKRMSKQWNTYTINELVDLLGYFEDENRQLKDLIIHLGYTIIKEDGEIRLLKNEKLR